jgi:hypothetical protein
MIFINIMAKIKIYVEDGSSNMTPRFIELLKEFILFTTKFVKIETPFTLHLVHSKVPQLRTTGVYINNDREMWIRVKNRHQVDLFRSICHEMVHHKQNELNMLDKHSGDDASPEEGQANRIAGIVMRKFGRIYPEIYE